MNKNSGYIIPGAYDYRTESEMNLNKIPVIDDLVILFDGIFLHRDEICKYWDLSIFIDITFETMLKRALPRDIELFKSEEEITKRYKKRYIPGEKIYLEKCLPKDKAQIVIDNNDYLNPKILWAGKRMQAIVDSELSSDQTEE